jgi:uncharacterized paraquat-inducible protein A
MRYKESNYSSRNWYGENKKYRVYKKKQKSMFYEVIHWFETWVLIFLFTIGLIILYIYLN